MIGWSRTLFVAALFLLSAGLPASASEKTESVDAPFFQMPEDQKTRLIEGLKRINLGDSWNDTRKILGKPDMDEIELDKETAKFKAFMRQYNVYLVSDGANVNDEVVLLYFDKEEKLIAIFSTIKEYIREDYIR